MADTLKETEQTGPERRGHEETHNERRDTTTKKHTITKWGNTRAESTEIKQELLTETWRQEENHLRGELCVTREP